MGLAFYLIGCLICFFLLDRKKGFDCITVIFILLSWMTLIATIAVMKDKEYKRLEDKEK